jgi:diguanylate cyclase (GGDEF)-like protein
LPLEIDKTPLGYLAVSGVKEAEEDKFNILAQQFLLGAKRAHLYQKIQELAITDSLTGSLSRGFYMERFKEELERSEKFRFNFSLLMADIDHFKQCNDNYGHLVGDAILKEVAKTLKENIRQIDLIGRYGGEEFSIILIETDKEGAKFAAERIRQALEARHIRVYDEDLKVTVSIGISTYPGDARDVQALIERADEALYQAKQGGRNRVCVYGDDAR